MDPQTPPSPRPCSDCPAQISPDAHGNTRRCERCASRRRAERQRARQQRYRDARRVSPPPDIREVSERVDALADDVRALQHRRWTAIRDYVLRAVRAVRAAR